MKKCKIIHINDGSEEIIINQDFHFMEELPWAEEVINEYLNEGYEVKQMIPDITPGDGGYYFYKTGFTVYLEKEC